MSRPPGEFHYETNFTSSDQRLIYAEVKAVSSTNVEVKRSRFVGQELH